MSNLINRKWCKNVEKWLKPWHMGTHPIVLSESYSMNTNMTGFGWFSKIFSIFLLWTKVASVLEGSTFSYLERVQNLTHMDKSWWQCNKPRNIWLKIVDNVQDNNHAWDIFQMQLCLMRYVQRCQIICVLQMQFRLIYLCPEIYLTHSHSEIH